MHGPLNVKFVIVKLIHQLCRKGPADPEAQWNLWVGEAHQMNKKLKSVVSFGLDSVRHYLMIKFLPVLCNKMLAQIT